MTFGFPPKWPWKWWHLDEPPEPPKWEQKVFHDYDMPEGRTPESFRYHCQMIWSGSVTDEFWTDDEHEAARLVRWARDEGYQYALDYRGPAKP